MQSKKHSALEAIIGTAVGFAISWALLTFVISPLFHLKTNYSEDFLITCIFTVASVLRSYGVRRFFNWLHHRTDHGIAGYDAEVHNRMTNAEPTDWKEAMEAQSRGAASYVRIPDGMSIIEAMNWLTEYDRRETPNTPENIHDTLRRRDAGEPYPFPSGSGNNLK